MGVDGTIKRYAAAKSNDTGMNNLQQRIWLGRMSRGDRVSQARWRTRDCHPYGIGGLISLLDPGEIAEEDRRQPKDGPCFVPGVLAPLPSGEVALRQRDRVTEINVLVADFDMGTPFASLQARLQAAGVLALVTPTYSHLRQSFAFRAAPARWQDYLSTFGSPEAAVLAHGATAFLPAIVEGGLAGPVSIKLADPKKPGGALIVSFSWARPVPRWRVAVPLAHGWKVEDGPSIAAADAWAKLYHELVHALGLWDCDPICSDASRLYFTARWPAAWPVAERDPAWKTIAASLVAGEPGPGQALVRIEGPIAELPGLLARRDRLNWKQRLGKEEDQLRCAFEAASREAQKRLPQITGTRGRRQAGAPRELVPWLVRHPETGEQVDLTAWHQRHGWHLELATLIQEQHPDLIVDRGEGAGGNLHILCPASDLHGTDRDDGTFVWDGDGLTARGEPGARRGGMFCNHTACAGRSAGENLALLLDAGVLDWDLLAAIAAKGEAERLAVGQALLAEGDDLFDEASDEAPSANASATTTPDPGETPEEDQGVGDDTPEPPGSKRNTAPPVLDPATPLTSARVMIDRHFMRAGQRALQHLQSVFYRWTGMRYRELTHEEVVAQVYRFLERANQLGKDGLKPFNPNRTKAADIVEALAAAAQLPRLEALPVWLGKVGQPPANEILACRNGLLHWPSRTLLPHTPSFFGLNCLPYAYQSDFGPPGVWLRFLASVWPDDQASIDTLQELFGLLLTSDTRYQKLFLLIGPKRSGKGTIARIIQALRGKEATAWPTLASFGENFGLASLIDKPIAIIPDARLDSRVDVQVLAERLLAISGEDGMSVPRKYLADWIGSLPTRFVILTNPLPKVTDVSGALASRFIILQMVISFYGREDHQLGSKLRPELPGILNWALAGLDRLTRRGYFQQPESAAQMVEDLAGLSSPHTVFLRERCRVGRKETVVCSTLYQAWCDWCRINGHKQPGTTQDLGRNLRAALPTIRTRRQRDPANRHQLQDCYAGIGLLPRPEAEDEPEV
jgi:putative DNA primase/helicase